MTSIPIWGSIPPAWQAKVRHAAIAAGIAGMTVLLGDFLRTAGRPDTHTSQHRYDGRASGKGHGHHKT